MLAPGESGGLPYSLLSVNHLGVSTVWLPSIGQTRRRTFDYLVPRKQSTVLILSLARFFQMSNRLKKSALIKVMPYTHWVKARSSLVPLGITISTDTTHGLMDSTGRPDALKMTFHPFLAGGYQFCSVFTNLLRAHSFFPHVEGECYPLKKAKQAPSFALSQNSRASVVWNVLRSTNLRVPPHSALFLSAFVLGDHADVCPCLSPDLII